jgi:hypothetical protein
MSSVFVDARPCAAAPIAERDYLRRYTSTRRVCEELFAELYDRSTVVINFASR